MYIKFLLCESVRGRPPSTVQYCKWEGAVELSYIREKVGGDVKGLEGVTRTSTNKEMRRLFCHTPYSLTHQLGAR